MSTQFPILSSSLATYSPLHGLRMKLLVHFYERVTVSTLSLYFLWIVTRTLLFFPHFFTHPCRSPDQDTSSFRYFLWMAHSFSLPFLEVHRSPTPLPCFPGPILPRTLPFPALRHPNTIQSLLKSIRDLPFACNPSPKIQLWHNNQLLNLIQID